MTDHELPRSGLFTVNKLTDTERAFRGIIKAVGSACNAPTVSSLVERTTEENHKPLFEFLQKQADPILISVL